MDFFSPSPSPLGRTTGGGTFFFLRSVRGSACRMCVCVCCLHCTTHCIAANWRWLHCFVYPRRRSQKKEVLWRHVCPSVSVKRAAKTQALMRCDLLLLLDKAPPDNEIESNRIGENTSYGATGGKALSIFNEGWAHYGVPCWHLFDFPIFLPQVISILASIFF